MSNTQNILNNLRSKLASYESQTKVASDNQNAISDNDLINALRKQADEAGNTASAKAPLKHKPENEGDDLAKSKETGASKDIKADSESTDENVSTKKASDEQVSLIDGKFMSSVYKVAGVTDDNIKVASEEDAEKIYDSIYKSAYHVASSFFRGGK